MGGIEWLLEIALVGLLAATLFHALRLERALGVLKRDRAALQQLVDGFNASTRQAQAGIDQLRGAADNAGRQVARQMETGAMLKDDLAFLIERSERAADRLDSLVRSVRLPPADPPRPDLTPIERLPARPAAVAIRPDDADPEIPRLRSQAERDLMKALRLAR